MRLVMKLGILFLYKLFTQSSDFFGEEDDEEESDLPESDLDSLDDCVFLSASAAFLYESLR